MQTQLHNTTHEYKYKCTLHIAHVRVRVRVYVHISRSLFTLGGSCFVLQQQQHNINYIVSAKNVLYMYVIYANVYTPTHARIYLKTKTKTCTTN